MFFETMIIQSKCTISIKLQKLNMEYVWYSVVNNNNWSFLVVPAQLLQLLFLARIVQSAVVCWVWPCKTFEMFYIQYHISCSSLANLTNDWWYFLKKSDCFRGFVLPTNIRQISYEEISVGPTSYCRKSNFLDTRI